MPSFPFNEKYLSQIPALIELINLGYTCLTPEQVRRERGERSSGVLLENILREQLKRINRIDYKGREYRFSEENIQSAIQRIKDVRYDGLLKTSEAIYDLLTLGTALEQTMDGQVKSFTLNYVDWKRPGRNVFHAVAEFSVERSRSTATARPDIVLFVNGIPWVVIECKSPATAIEQAISQQIRNQHDDYIPGLFVYTQILLAANKNSAKYATTGTDKEFWSVWRESDDSDKAITACVNKPLSEGDKEALFSGEFATARSHFDALAREGEQSITEQDKCLYSLCRPARLLEIAYGFIVFESHTKKIARYQQFFLVRSAMRRIKKTDGEGRRRGGIVWHTQGSGKSITMVMLVRAIALDANLTGSRIILVTDRKDLDLQLGNTFAACGLDKQQASSGRNLVKHIRNKVGIVTTLINKFETALSAEKYIDESPNILVLVDESHRTNFGELAANMRKMLPNACYIGFTGTPLLKEEKNSFVRFGELIEPSYPVRQAVEDGAVVPLLYEGRHVGIKQDKKRLDRGFQRTTGDLSDEQKADLKKKFSRYGEIDNTDQVVGERAFDISRHFRENWQGTGFKGQLVASTKAAALKYHQYLKEEGHVSSAVIISAPDTREGYEEVGGESTDEVVRFWNQMMQVHGKEEDYNRNIVDGFKDGDHPEILIVVDKLITGFDVPRNVVLYLCRGLREHTLLQAIARVNRLHENKEYGYIIDYANVLGELDRALTAYEALAGFDNEDLADLLASINEQASRLPQVSSDLWNLFKELKSSRNEEDYERLLADKTLREEFRDRLADYAKTLAIALSSEKFLGETDEETLQRYKNDMKRFEKLRASVQLRYGEAVDYSKYAPRIRKLLDAHIKADEATQINAPVNILDKRTLASLREGKEGYETKGEAARADMIAHTTMRKISESMEKDPAFYEKFSKLIQKAIDDFREQRISDLEYLQRTGEICEKVVSRKRDDVPENIRDDEEGCAYFGVVKPFLSTKDENSGADALAADFAITTRKALQENWKVDFQHDSSAQSTVKNALDDFLYDEVKDKNGIALTPEQMDEIIDNTLRIAEHWRRG